MQNAGARGKEFGFKVRHLSITNGGLHMPTVVPPARGAPTFSDWCLQSEAYDDVSVQRRADDPPCVVVSVIPMTPNKPLHLNQEAAKSMKFGGPVPVTSAQARDSESCDKQRGIAKRVGSLDAGQGADSLSYITIRLA